MSPLSQPAVVVIGAGIGGLVAALRLAVHGVDVTVLDQFDSPGGKMREVVVNGARIDAGPTVLTMRWVFDEIFESAGTSLEARVGLTRLSVLARHAWAGGESLDLHADAERTAHAIADFAGAREADGFRRFSQRAQKIYKTLDRAFIERPCDGPAALMKAVGLRGLPGLTSIAPFTPMHDALKAYFRDPRLLQLFGRYATYCGSSPYLAPATLMLVPYVEQCGVWSVDGGMHKLATALAELAWEYGVSFRYGTKVSEIVVREERVAGVVTSSEEYIRTDTVIVNADAQAVARGHFGDAASRAVPAIAPEQRSLSAITWAMVASCSGFPLVRHNVFFSNNYRAEFDQIFRQHRLPDQPTVYVCAQDRLDTPFTADSARAERVLCLVNAPAKNDVWPLDPKEIQRCERESRNLLEQCGLNLTCTPRSLLRTDPEGFEHLFPATGGALYGQASHGWNASFQRPGARTLMAGLYLAGGSTHPGPGVPMAAHSGRMSAEAVLADRSLTVPYARTATHGGISTR